LKHSAQAIDKLADGCYFCLFCHRRATRKFAKAFSPDPALSLFRFRLYRMALWWGDLYIAPSPVLGGLKIRFFFAFFLLLCYFTSIYA